MNETITFEFNVSALSFSRILPLPEFGLPGLSFPARTQLISLLPFSLFVCFSHGLSIGNFEGKTAPRRPSARRRVALEVSADGVAFHPGAVNRRRVCSESRDGTAVVPGAVWPARGRGGTALAWLLGQPSRRWDPRRARHPGDQHANPLVVSTVAACGICATRGGLRQRHLKKHCQRRLAVLWPSSPALPSIDEHFRVCRQCCAQSIAKY